MEIIATFIDWLFANWIWLLLIVFGVVEFILLLIFRRDKVFDNSITYRLLSLIESAEFKYGSGHGKEKLAYVISLFKQLYPNEHIPDLALKDFIELILNTPQKKGGK